MIGTISLQAHQHRVYLNNSSDLSICAKMLWSTSENQGSSSKFDQDEMSVSILLTGRQSGAGTTCLPTNPLVSASHGREGVKFQEKSPDYHARETEIVRDHGDVKGSWRSSIDRFDM
jgi:hypothetical protein